MKNLEVSALVKKNIALDKLPDDRDEIVAGDWYLLDQSQTSAYLALNCHANNVQINSDLGEILVCADTFESNLVVFKSNACQYKVLNKDLHTVIRPIPHADAAALIQSKVTKQQQAIAETKNKIQEIVAKISMSGMAKSESTEVAVVSKNALTEQKNALVNVHSKNIETLNNTIKDQVKELYEISHYYGLPAQTGISNLSQSKQIVDDKLHELNLYGAIDESEVVLASGYVADENAPIHIFQNLKYMDVECILGYESGGIEINNSDISAFNDWLARPENRDRILPEQKCIVAIKNRKHPSKNRSYYQPKNKTFIYLRNGENIKSIHTNLDIKSTLLATEHEHLAKMRVKYVSIFSNSDKLAFISNKEYQQLFDTCQKSKAAYLDCILKMHQKYLHFTKEFLSYALTRQQILSQGNSNGNGFEAIIKYNDDREKYRLMSNDEVDLGCEHLTNQIKRIEDNIANIKCAIENDCCEPNCSFPSISKFSSHWGFELIMAEIGFKTPQGTRYMMRYPMREFMEDLDALHQDFKRFKLYMPNESIDRFARDTDPFNILRALEGYKPVNEDHYFFDTIKQVMWSKYKRQNDLAILIQGILDRSSFFGHSKINLFADGFGGEIKLVYDKDKGLYDGDMPDFRAFIKSCNEGSQAGDLFYGHKKLWDKKQEEKSREARYHEKTTIPKFLQAEKIINKRDGRTVVKFRWETPREWYSQAKKPMQTHIFECDINDLINVSNYPKGSIEPFIKDPRCREQYPKWGDLITMAEYYHQKQ